ncbi:acyl-CoA Delta(11) desaturase-like [Maniola jurtina]|uniref:acyl-CoA Delta(11) desaturase-like n=1 Tax=Maniola jurtina TaxID=191418 RepID=UPI001E68A610|nr:acyl-CoA Delta(11) desaturase-like [Maniola jurtina]XP_045779958.1 acyl-CoA Delta(11) desaturase-like [Maniola jurtina]
MASFATESPPYKEFEDPFPKLVAPQAAPRKYEILYLNVLKFTYLHIASLYGIYVYFTTATWRSLIFYHTLLLLASVGVTAGAHRLWSHRSYKAKMPLQILLMLMNSLTFVKTTTDFVRDHRLHHRYSDTDADPHNATRGFFYSHIGWLMVKKHPEVLRRGKLIDMTDIHANPVLRFQKKYAIPLIGALCFVLPTIIPMVFFGATLNTAWHLTILFYTYRLNGMFSVNSAAHLWGNKPYDKQIKPVQNYTVSFVTHGEGFHNYHHAFPWDYRAAELGNNWLNFTTKFIDFFAWIGWAYDLKGVPEDVVHARANRTGDGSDLWGFKRDKNFKIE